MVLHPGHLSNKDRQNLEALEPKQAVINTLSATLTPDIWHKPVRIGLVPKGHILIPIMAIVSEPFGDGSFAQIQIGTKSNPNAFYHFSALVPGEIPLLRSNNTFHLKKLSADTVMYAVGSDGTSSTSGSVPTNGLGLVIFQHVKV